MNLPTFNPSPIGPLPPPPPNLISSKTFNPPPRPINLKSFGENPSPFYDWVISLYVNEIMKFKIIKILNGNDIQYIKLNNIFMLKRNTVIE